MLLVCLERYFQSHFKAFEARIGHHGPSGRPGGPSGRIGPPGGGRIADHLAPLDDGPRLARGRLDLQPEIVGANLRGHIFRVGELLEVPVGTRSGRLALYVRSFPSPLR